MTMASRRDKGPGGIPGNEGPLKRRDLLKMGLAGIVLSGLNRGCENKSSSNPPDPSDQAYELTDGQALYDDFDGHGCLQTYNNENLAEAGKLSSRIWAATAEGAEVVDNPVGGGLLAVVNEDGQRVEYRRDEEKSREIKYVYDADGRLLRASSHVPGEPYHGSRKLFWTGARNGRLVTAAGPMIVEKGKVYGTAELEPMSPSGRVLKLASRLAGFMGLILTSRRDVEFKDCRRLCGDIMVPSSATGTDYWASVDYHTTIPEQPPGVSWFTEFGIRKFSGEELRLFAQCINRNTEYRVYFDIGKAEPDTWYSFRMDVVTQRDDPALAANELRIDYYINGELKGYEFPWDGELLLNPDRTGSGPDRYVRLLVENPGGESIAYFDNIEAVYSNRIR
jgi:hypothetical protein